MARNETIKLDVKNTAVDNYAVYAQLFPVDENLLLSSLSKMALIGAVESLRDNTERLVRHLHLIGLNISRSYSITLQSRGY